MKKKNSGRVVVPTIKQKSELIVDGHLPIPFITVSEISRILVNTRKNYLNRYDLGDKYKIAYLGAVDDIRKALELRRRSRSHVLTHV